MSLSQDVIMIIFNYTKPFTIKYMSKKKKILLGICYKKNCFNYLQYCKYCWFNFNIAYKFIYKNNIGYKIYQQDKILKYYMFKNRIQNFDFCNYISKTKKNLLIKNLFIDLLNGYKYNYSQYFDYKHIFLFLVIFYNNKNIYV